MLESKNLVSCPKPAITESSNPLGCEKILGRVRYNAHNPPFGVENRLRPFQFHNGAGGLPGGRKAKRNPAVGPLRDPDGPHPLLLQEHGMSCG